MQRPWIGATAEALLAGPSRGRGRRRVLYRYAVTDDGLVEVGTPDEVLASLGLEPETPIKNAALSASPTGGGLFSGSVGPVPNPPETATAPEGAASA